MSVLPPLPIVVLTGGIGSGKSTAAAHWQSLGVRVTDADELSQQLTRGQDGPALPRIRAVLGDDVFQPDGQLDRAALRQRVFERPEELKQLEGILHPLIQERASAQFLREPDAAEAEAGYQLYVVPLWLEATARHGRPDWAWQVVVVDLPPDTQRLRTLARARGGLHPGTLEAILQRQASREARLQAADHVLWNGEDSPKPLLEAVESLHCRLRHLLNSPPP